MKKSAILALVMALVPAVAMANSLDRKPGVRTGMTPVEALQAASQHPVTLVVKRNKKTNAVTIATLNYVVPKGQRPANLRFDQQAVKQESLPKGETAGLSLDRKISKPAFRFSYGAYVGLGGAGIYAGGGYGYRGYGGGSAYYRRSYARTYTRTSYYPRSYGYAWAYPRYGAGYGDPYYSYNAYDGWDDDDNQYALCDWDGRYYDYY